MLSGINGSPWAMQRFPLGSAPIFDASGESTLVKRLFPLVGRAGSSIRSGSFVRNRTVSVGLALMTYGVSSPMKMNSVRLLSARETSSPALVRRSDVPTPLEEMREAEIPEKIK